MADGIEDSAVIIDTGSFTTKIGYAGDDTPRYVFRTVVGRPKHNGIMGFNLPDVFVGDDALSRRGILKLQHPIEHGIMWNADNTEAVWKHAYQKLEAAPEEHAVVVTEPPFVPLSVREKQLQIFFENFNVPSYYTATTSVFSLMATGRMTGISIESGGGSTAVMPIIDGRVVPNASQQSTLDGECLTNYTMRLLTNAGYSVTTSAELELVRACKEQLGLVSLDYGILYNQTVEEKTFELPDIGIEWKLGRERFSIPEPLFNPSLVGFSAYGIHDTVHQVYRKVPVELRPQLTEVVLTGGNTLWEGLQERLQKELNFLFPPAQQLSVSAPFDRKYAAWTGASIFSSLSGFANSAISKDEYDEVGPQIVHAKCK